MSPNRVLFLFVSAVLVAAGCTSAAGSSAAPVGAASSPAANGGGAVVVNASKTPSFGTVLTGPNGMTLYTHAGDSATSSSCTGACATAWPPLAATSQPMAGPGVTGRLGTLTRSDGTQQVTYAGKPLYYWQGDTKAGDVTGNGIEGFAVATVAAGAAAPNASAAPKTTAAPAAMPSGSGGYRY